MPSGIISQGVVGHLIRLLYSTRSYLFVSYLFLSFLPSFIYFTPFLTLEPLHGSSNSLHFVRVEIIVRHYKPSIISSFPDTGNREKKKEHHGHHTISLWRQDVNISWLCYSRYVYLHHDSLTKTNHVQASSTHSFPSSSILQIISSFPTHDGSSWSSRPHRHCSPRFWLLTSCTIFPTGCVP